MVNSFIISCGSYLPQNVITNEDLAKYVDTNDEWITKRTGIKKRHFAKGLLTSDLAYQASQKALDNANMKSAELDAIIVATTTSDKIFPSTAMILQEKIAARNAFGFDIQAVCSGFIYALSVADALIKSNQAKKILVVGAETLSYIVDHKDRKTCVLFGDGAGAVILGSCQNENQGILSKQLGGEGKYSSILNTSGDISTMANEEKNSGKITMEGKEVFRHAVEKMTKSASECMNKIGLNISDINWFIPHQANIRILDTVAKKLGIAKEKTVITVDKHANTSAASIPLALDSVWHKIKKDDLILMSAIGGGLAWGSIIIRK